MSAWKPIARRFAAAFLVLGLCGCENNAAEAETAISGDSRLVIFNQSGSDARVLFDHEYIGRIRPLESRSWQVPAGRHAVSIGGNAQDMDFRPGLTLTVTFQLKTACGRPPSAPAAG
ncbi:MAG: hypothetical protein EOM72_10235 [Opitutae bacterium]|nr:hypothetical protein [Opitutae bacterium]